MPKKNKKAAEKLRRAIANKTLPLTPEVEPEPLEQDLEPLERNPKLLMPNEIKRTLIAETLFRFNTETESFERSFDLIADDSCTNLGLILDQMFLNGAECEYNTCDNTITLGDVEKELHEMLGELQTLADEYGDDATLRSLAWD